MQCTSLSTSPFQKRSCKVMFLNQSTAQCWINILLQYNQYLWNRTSLKILICGHLSISKRILRVEKDSLIHQLSLYTHYRWKLTPVNRNQRRKQALSKIRIALQLCQYMIPLSNRYNQVQWHIQFCPHVWTRHLRSIQIKLQKTPSYTVLRISPSL